MDYTENLSLIKPAKAEQFNIDYHNTNSDIIDAAFKSEVETRISVDTALQEQIDLNRNEDRRIGIVPVAKGGTGETTAQAALNALHGSVSTESSINAEDEVTFIRRTAADASTETPETIDLKDVTLQTLADKVYDLIRGDSAVFSSTKNGLVPKSGAAGNALYLNAAGGWTEPGFSESTMDINSSREVEIVSQTILTFTASQSVTVVLKDCDKRGVTATFFNPTEYRHTLSLKFFGGSDTAYIKAGETVRLWWTGSAWLNLALLAHGISSLYWSSDSTDPKYIYGGTWTRIKDRFVLAAGDTYTTVPVGNATSGDGVGGKATVQLTESNLPAHDHGGSTGHTQPLFYGKESKGSFAAWGTEKQFCWANGVFSLSPSYVDYGAGHSKAQGAVFNFSMTPGGFVQNHNHAISSCGGNVPHENMPPYLVKFCWERTA